MVTKGQWKAAIDQHPFFHRKIARSGASRYLAIGRMIPEDWLMVRVQVKKLDAKVCVLEITKLD